MPNDELKARVEGLRNHPAIFLLSSAVFQQLRALIDLVLAGWDHCNLHTFGCWKTLDTSAGIERDCNCGLPARQAAIAELRRRLGNEY